MLGITSENFCTEFVRILAPCIVSYSFPLDIFLKILCEIFISTEPMYE